MNIPDEQHNYHDDEYGDPCEEIKALRRYLEEHHLAIWSEHGEPFPWVNVGCEGHPNQWGGIGHIYEGMLEYDGWTG